MKWSTYNCESMWTIGLSWHSCKNCLNFLQNLSSCREFFMIFWNLRKLCENISLLYSPFIKLLERSISNLAAVLSLELLQVSIRNGSLKCNWDVINFTAISMRIDFIHVMKCKLTSSLARYSRSGDYIRWVVEKSKCENNVMMSVAIWKIF